MHTLVHVFFICCTYVCVRVRTQSREPLHTRKIVSTKTITSDRHTRTSAEKPTRLRRLTTGWPLIPRPSQRNWHRRRERWRSQNSRPATQTSPTRRAWGTLRRQGTSGRERWRCSVRWILLHVHVQLHWLHTVHVQYQAYITRTCMCNSVIHTGFYIMKGLAKGLGYCSVICYKICSVWLRVLWNGTILCTRTCICTLYVWWKISICTHACTCTCTCIQLGV